MSNEGVLLNSVGQFVVGNEAISRIELRSDGKGPMGFYDVIYIYVDEKDVPWRAIPAHNCNEWEYF